MVIKTKFDPNQEVFFMTSNKLRKGTVKGIQIGLSDKGIVLMRYLTSLGVWIEERELYGSKNALLTDISKEEREPIKTV